MFSFLCSWDDSSSVSSGLSDTLDNLSTDDLNTASSVSSYSNITASSRKNTHAQVSSFLAICCNIPIQDRKSLVSMHLNEWGIHILQNPLLHLDARSHRLHWPNLGHSKFPAPRICVTAEGGGWWDPALPTLGEQPRPKPLLHPNTKQTQYDWICDHGLLLISAHLEHLFQQITQ